MAEEKLGTLEYEMLISQKKLEDQLEEITRKLKEEDKKWKEILSGSGTIASPKIDVANIDKLTKANKQIVLSNDQIASSIEKLKVQLAENVANYEKLTAEQRDNEKVGGKLLATIQQQKDQLDQYNKILRENITARKQAAQEAINQAKSEESAKRSLEAQRSKAFVKSNLDEEKRITQEIKNQESALRALEAQRSKAFVKGELQKERELTAEIKKQESALRSLEAQRSKAFVSQKNKELREQIALEKQAAQEQKLRFAIESQQTGSVARLRAEIALYTFQLGQIKKITPETTAEIRRLNAAINANKQEIAALQPTLGFWGKLSSAIRTYVTAYLSVQGAMAIGRAVYNQTKELDALSFSMQTVIKSSVELAQTQKFLSDVAINYGGDLLTLSERYVKFRAAAIQANMSAAETQKIYDSVSKAAGTLGLKTDELSGVYLALEQMISKGKVTTEELRRQLGERLPGAFGIMANALGKTIPELDKMLKKGEVLSSDALPKFAAALEKAYGLEAVDKIDTLAAAQGRLSTQFTELIRSAQASDAFKNLINGVASFLGFIKDNIGTIALFSKALLSVVAATTAYRLVSAASLPVQRALLIMFGSQTTALTQLSFAQLRVVAAQRAAIAGTTAWTRAWNALKIAFTTNPLGVIITGITLLGTGLYMLSGKAKETQRTFTSFADNLSAEKAKLEQLFTSLQKAGKGTYEYKDALFQINNLYGKYLPNLLTEKSSIDEVTKARKKANEALTEEMMLRERNSRLEKASAEKDRLLAEILNDIIAASPSISAEKKGQIYARILDVASIGELDPDKRRKLIQKAFKGDLDAIEEYVEKATIALLGYEAAVKGIDAFFSARASGGKKEVVFDPEELKRAKEEFDKYSGLISESTKKQFIEESPYVTQAIDTYEKYLRKQLELFKDNQAARVTIENELTSLLEKGSKARVNIEEKRAEAINKLNAKYLQDQEDFANYEMGIQATRIANMEDGIEKERALDQLKYENRIKAINKEKEATLKLLNEAAGINIGSAREIKSLDATGYSPKIQKLLTEALAADMQKRKNAKKDLDESNLKSEKDYNYKIAEIRRDVNDLFLSGIEKEKAAVNEKYDEWAKKAHDNAETLKEIDRARNIALNDLNIDAAIDRLRFEEEIEYKKNEIRNFGEANRRKKEKEDFEIYKRTQLRIADALRGKGTDEERNKGLIIEQNLAYDEQLFKLKQAADLRQQIFDGAKQFTDSLIDGIGLSDDLADSLKGIVDQVSMIASGNWIGALFSAATEVVGQLLPEAVDESNKKLSLEEKNKKALEETNKALERQITLLQQLSGTDYFQLATKQAEDLRKSIQENLDLLRSSGAIKWQVGFLEDITKWSAEDFLKASLGQVRALNGEIIQFSEQEQDTLDAIFEKRKELAELMQATFQKVLGFDASTVADDIFSGIDEGLKLGKDGLGDFALSFGNLMKKALMQSIIEGMNIKLTEGFLAQYKDFLSATSDEGAALSESEKKVLEDTYIGIVRQAEIDSANIKSITDKYTSQSPADVSGLSKAIQGVTEDTARRLEGLINSIRETSVINMGNTKQLVESSQAIQGYAAQSLGHLRNIDATTAAQLTLFNEVMASASGTGGKGLKVYIQ